MGQPQTSEVGARKGRIKSEKTSDDMERQGTPVTGRRNRELKKKKSHVPSDASERTWDTALHLSEPQFVFP